MHSRIQLNNATAMRAELKRIQSVLQRVHVVLDPVRQSGSLREVDQKIAELDVVLAPPNPEDPYELDKGGAYISPPDCLR